MPISGIIMYTNKHDACISAYWRSILCFENNILAMYVPHNLSHHNHFQFPLDSTRWNGAEEYLRVSRPTERERLAQLHQWLHQPPLPPAWVCVQLPPGQEHPAPVLGCGCQQRQSRYADHVWRLHLWQLRDVQHGSLRGVGQDQAERDGRQDGQWNDHKHTRCSGHRLLHWSLTTIPPLSKLIIVTFKNN